MLNHLRQMEQVILHNTLTDSLLLISSLSRPDSITSIKQAEQPLG